MEYARLLSPISVHLDQLLLDPNNPRFSELGAGFAEVGESRFADPEVQEAAYEKMRQDTFDVRELRDTIKTLGFLPMDRIVVRSWNGADGKFVVIEGNRRLTALRWLLDLHREGKETLSPEQLEQFTNLEALLLDASASINEASIVLPGLRHVSGIKEWGPYQKAKTVAALRRNGASPQEAAQSLGLSTKAANTAYRCFIALEAFKADDEYGEFVQPAMYSYFEEVFKKPAVKNWLGWEDSSEQFMNAERLQEFYGWVVPPTNSDDVHKLPTALSVRDLAKVIDDEGAMSTFRSHEGTLQSALAQFAVEHPADWLPRITSASSALKNLSTAKLKGMDDGAVNALKELKSAIEETLRDREVLMGQN
jgi:hypothetical protein